MSAKIVDTLSIIGVGLIGGSIGMAAKARGLADRVIGIGRDSKRLQRAVELAAVDEVTTDLKAGVAKADLVVVCTPVLAIVPLINTISDWLKDGAIVTDVGSTKAEIVYGAEAALPEDRYFVGGHPMTGNENAGVEAAIPYLFLDSTYVVTPSETSSIQAVQTLVQFVEGLGANSVLISPEAHDRSAAIISHLPHVISAAILRLAANEEAKSGKVFQLAAGSFRDITRVAASPPEIWRDVCLSSKDAISGAIDGFIELLHAVREKIETGDADWIERLFTEAQELRASRVKVDVENPDD